MKLADIIRRDKIGFKTNKSFKHMNKYLVPADEVGIISSIIIWTYIESDEG